MFSNERSEAPGSVFAEADVSLGESAAQQRLMNGSALPLRAVLSGTNSSERGSVPGSAKEAVEI
jgi:hypothetical protein